MSVASNPICNCKDIRTYKGWIDIYPSDFPGVWEDAGYGSKPRGRWPSVNIAPELAKPHWYVKKIAAGTIMWKVEIEDCIGCTKKEINELSLIDVTSTTKTVPCTILPTINDDGFVPPAPPNSNVNPVPGAWVWVPVGSSELPPNETSFFDNYMCLECGGDQCTTWAQQFPFVQFGAGRMGDINLYPNRPLPDPRYAGLWHTGTPGQGALCQSPNCPGENVLYEPHWVTRGIQTSHSGIGAHIPHSTTTVNGTVTTIEFLMEEAIKCAECKRTTTTETAGNTGYANPPPPGSPYGTARDILGYRYLDVECRGYTCKKCEKGSAHGDGVLDPIFPAARSLPNFIGLLINNADYLEANHPLQEYMANQQLPPISLPNGDIVPNPDLWTDEEFDRVLEEWGTVGNPIAKGIANLSRGCGFKVSGPLYEQGGRRGAAIQCCGTGNRAVRPTPNDRTLESFCIRASRGTTYENL